MNADDFARRVLTRLNGTPAQMGTDDADLLSRCNVRFRFSAPVLFDAASIHELPAIVDVFTRSFGSAPTVFLPHIQDE